MNQKTLFALWGGFFVLCAGLGFVQDRSPLMTAAAVVFFLPPWVLLYRAGKAGDIHTLQLIRNLAALSLGLTALLLAVNFAAALGSRLLGDLVHVLLVVISSPMVCSGRWALSLFLWACLLMASMKEIRKTRT